MPLYNRLKEYRAKLGVNQQEMGALVQTSRQTISQIERGDYRSIGDSGTQDRKGVWCQCGGYIPIRG